MVLLFVEMIFLTKVEIIFMVNVQLRLSKKLVSGKRPTKRHDFLKCLKSGTLIKQQTCCSFCF